MKKIIVGMIVCFAAMSALGGEYRTFTDSQGRTIEAKIVEFNAAKGRVLIEREGGKQVWVAPDIFSEKDRMYIEEWVDAKEMLSDRNLRISLVKQKLGDFGSEQELREGEKICFDITLDNRADTALDGLRIEYFYYVQSINLGTKEKTEKTEKTVGGKLRLGLIEAKQSKDIRTKPLEIGVDYLKTSERAVTSYDGITIKTGSVINYVKSNKEQLRGIWIRVYGPEVGGVSSCRDVCFPSDLSKKASWKGSDSE